MILPSLPMPSRASRALSSAWWLRSMPRGDLHTGDAARRAAERKGERRAAHSRSQGDLSAPCSRPTSHHRLEGVGTGLACACVRGGRRVRFAQYLPPIRAPAQRNRPRGWGVTLDTPSYYACVRARKMGAPDKAAPTPGPPLRRLARRGWVTLACVRVRRGAVALRATASFKPRLRYFMGLRARCCG